VKKVVDPRQRPAYTLREASAYARVPLATARHWVRGRPARKTIRRNAVRPVIVAASAKPCLLSFINLVELFVLADLRRTHRVPLQRVRAALDFVEEKLGISQPLAHLRFKTDGLDLFVEHLAKGSKRAALVNVSGGGQVAVREALEARLARVEWDKAGMAARIFPLVRSEAVVQPRSIVLDPRRGFGRPVIAATGIRASVVAERYRAGESALELANDYNVDVEQIEDAIRCEISAAA
jgi:uncharacterized protein (DUF433 family)